MAALERITEEHARPSFAAPPEVFFGSAGRAGAWEERRVRSLGDGEVVDVRWRSEYEPLASDTSVRDRYLGRRENTWAHARLFRHREPRPTVEKDELDKLLKGEKPELV